MIKDRAMPRGWRADRGREGTGEKRNATWVLFSHTLTSTLGFMIWVLISSLMPYIKEDIKLTSTQLAWATAIPVLIGSVFRVPIGYWTNRYGARWLFVLTLLVSLFPVWWLSRAESFTDLVIAGLFIGTGGVLFSIGITSVPKYFPKEKQGFANGIFGASNIGTAITSFSAPVLAGAFGWKGAALSFSVLLVLLAILNLVAGDRHEPRSEASLLAQIREVYRNDKLWLLCIFYFITFGSFVAFTVYLPNFLVSHFHIPKINAGLRTAGFITLATIMRPIGGYLGDRWNPYSILMFVFAGLTVSAVILAFVPSILLFSIACLSVAFCAGLGNGALFKLVPLYFSKQAGIANGLIAAMGGLGGFFPPLLLTFLYNRTGHYSIGFMALSEVALASFILVMWLSYQEKIAELLKKPSRV